MESCCKTQAGWIKWDNIYSNQINLQLPLDRIRRAIDLGSYKVHSDSYTFWSGLYCLFIMLFSLYNIYFLAWFLQEPSATTACMCVCLWSVLAGCLGSEVPAQRLPPICRTEKGMEGCSSWKKLYCWHFAVGLMTHIPSGCPDPFPWSDGDFCPALAKQGLYTGGGFLDMGEGRFLRLL